MAKRSALITVMARAAEAAGRQLLRDFGDVAHLQVSRKGPADFVSQADKRSEAILLDSLSRSHPESSFLAEESGESGDADAAERWILDPLDGTTNFLHGLPHWSISIALQREGELVAGLVHDPLKDETFWAEKGEGAYLGARRLHVSRREALADCLLATGLPFKGHGDSIKVARQVARMTAQTSGVRRFGSAALDLAYVAASRYDAYWEAELSPWDTAAGLLLVQEASGATRSLERGADYDPFAGEETLVCGNPLLVEVLTPLLRL